MSESVPSDHPTVDSHRLSVGQVGRTGRPELVLPDEIGASDGDTIYLAFDDEDTYAVVTSTLDGDRAIRGAFANRRLARADGEGENLLKAWLERCGFGPGDAVVLDVLTDGFAYGLREPGARVVYSPPDPPDASLSEIASSLTEEPED